MLDNKKKGYISDSLSNDAETAPEHEAKPKRFYDDDYIKAYCDDPKAGKSAALVKAGYVGDYLAQEAYRIHNRLREKIRTTMDKLILDGGDIGYSVLVELCKNSDSDSVRVTAAKNLMDYAGRKPGDTLTVKHEESIEDIDSKIAELQQSIGKSEGKELH